MTPEPNAPDEITPLVDAIAAATFERQASAQPCDWPYHQADARAILNIAELAWLRQFLVDTLNTDFLSAYQCELVGEVPPSLLHWASIGPDWAES